MDNLKVSTSVLRNAKLGSYLMVEVSDVAPTSSLPPPMIKLVLDVSGSMADSMVQVKTTALAAVDAIPNGSSISVVAFDTSAKTVVNTILNDENRAVVKKAISAGIINTNGGTNLEEAVSHCFKDEKTNVLFMTDGLANQGLLRSSKDLIGLSRSFSNYSSCIVNTLGIQQSSETVLNAELLKQLAIDTNGTFRLAPDAESLHCFVGDVLAGYSLRKFDRVDIEVMSSNGLRGKIVSRPLSGFVIRTDRPTRAVFEISPLAFGPYIVTVHAMPAFAGSGLMYNTFKREAELNDESIVAIVGFIAANAMECGMERSSETQSFISEVFEFAQIHPKLMPIAYALNNFNHHSRGRGKEDAESIHLSQQLYNFSSLGGAEQDVSPAVMELRAASATLASQQTQLV
jgi:hypothetical protein